MKDIMIDLETMGRNPDAAVIQIGACVFDRNTGETGAEFLLNVDLQSCIDIGCSITGDTVYWWMQQSEDARSIVSKPGLPVKDVLNKLVEFVKAVPDHRIWSHEGFDFPILKTLFAKSGIKEPWRYSAGRGIRAVVDLSGIDYKTSLRAGVAHTALDDCKHQVTYLCKAIAILRGNDAAQSS